MDTDDSQKLEDYAVDVGELKSVHQKLVVKRSEIEALVAEEQNMGPIETMTDVAKEHLKSKVDQLLDEWEKEKIEDGVVATGSAAFNKLAQEHFDFEQQILQAEDEQVEEATHHPFAHPLR
jgi:hypothetical protein